MGSDLTSFLNGIPADRLKILNNELDKVTVNKNV